MYANPHKKEVKYGAYFASVECNAITHLQNIDSPVPPPRMRVCERMGSFVGIYDPYDFTLRLPIEVTAVKLSQLFAVQRHDLIDVLEMVRARERRRPGREARVWLRV